MCWNQEFFLDTSFLWQVFIFLLFSLVGVFPIGTSNGISSLYLSCTLFWAFTLQASFIPGLGVSLFWGPGSFTGPPLVLEAAFFVVRADVAF